MPTDVDPTSPDQPGTDQPGRSAPTGGTGDRRRANGRARFWVGFVLGFALLAVASCGGVALSLGLGRLSLAELRGDGTAWVPPTLMPTPETPPALDGDPAGGGSGSARFAAGSIARNITSSRVNVRRTAGHLGKPGDDVLLQIEPGEEVEILGETMQADNLTWYRVLFKGSEGWVAESTASGVQILGQ